MATRLVSLSIALLLLFQPVAVFAQVPSAPPLTGTTTPISPTAPTLTPTQTAQGYTLCPDGSIAVPGKQCANTAATNAVLNHFTPGLKTGTGDGNNFNGLSFSGVGGAVLGCTNIGDSIVSGVSNLFKNSEKQKKDDLFNALTQASGVGLNDTSTTQPVYDAKATAELQKQTQRENCLNGIAYAVAKNVLQQISSKTLNWVNTGFNGNPFYVRDIDSYLTSIKNDKITDFLNTVPNSDPIFGNALRSSITELATGYSDGRINQLMNTPQAQAYQNFQNDFTQGGWSAFLNPSNNPLGALFKATDTIGGNVSTAQQNVKDQLQAGNGFLNMQKCVEYEKQSATSAINPNGAYASLCATITPQNQAYCKANAPQVAAGSQQAKCLRYETVTPGSIIAAQTAAVTTSPIRQTEQANKINEVLGSFFDGLVNRLFSQGLGSLASGSYDSSIGYGNNVVIGSNGLPISTDPVSVEDAFGYQRVNGGFNGEFDISRPQQLRAVLKAQMDFLDRSEDTRVAMSSIIPTLGRLDYCLPGPNPSWPVGTNYNFQLFDSALQGKEPSKTLGNTISGLSTIGAAIPGPGTIVAAVGNVVGGLLNLAGGDQPKEVSTQGLQLFDKVTNGARQISDYDISRKSLFDNIDLVAYLERNYETVVEQYKDLFSPAAITSAFVATNPSNAADITGEVNDILDETGNLVYYNQAIVEYNKEQVDNITQTEDAIQTLQTINDEVEGIVATAKARYIKAQAAAGTPVTMACINQAYDVSTVPVVGVPRVESDTPDPIIEESREATNYFYNHL